MASVTHRTSATITGHTMSQSIFGCSKLTNARARALSIAFILTVRSAEHQRWIVCHIFDSRFTETGTEVLSSWAKSCTRSSSSSQRRKLRGEARDALRIRAQLVEPQARRLEIARKMLQALVRSLFDKPLGQQAGQVFLNIAAGLGKRLRHLLELLLQCGMLSEDGPDETRYLVGEQGNARARLFAAPVEIRPGPRPGFLHAGAVERGCEQLFLQVSGAAEGHELREYRLQTRQILLDMAGLLLELQHEQAPQAGAVSLARLVRGIEHLETDGIAVIRQTRIPDQRLGAAPDLHHFLEIAELPSGDFFRRRVGPCELGELVSGLLAELGAQLGEVATGGKLPAVLVDDAEIHRKMCGQHLLPEGI